MTVALLIPLIPFTLLCLVAWIILRWQIARGARRGIQQDWLKRSLRGGVGMAALLVGGVVVIAVASLFTSNAHRVDNAGGVYMLSAFALLSLWRLRRWLRSDDRVG